VNGVIIAVLAVAFVVVVIAVNLLIS